MPLRDALQQALGSQLTLDRELAGGGMARVFVARDARLGREIVVKTIAPDLAGSVNAERFEREISIAARLQHPQIVPLLDAGDVDGVPFYTMPLVEGDSLRHRLERGELSISETVTILRDVARALEYAHAKGVVHRDIKPDNVLLTGHSASVTDFGVAKALASATRGDELTGIGVALGTPAYMAPEQGAGDPNVDARADIYAFGVMAYEMLAGHPPFSGRTPTQTIAAHALEIPTPIAQLRPAVPSALASLVMRCLEKRPADRPTSAAALIQALDTVSVSGAGAASSRVRLRPIAIVATLVVLAAAGAAFAVLRQPRLNTKRVAVMPFDDLTGDPRFANVGRMASDWISRGIEQTDSVESASGPVMPPNRERPGLDGARAAARKLRAGTVVTGAVYRRADSLYYNAQINDVASGRLVMTVENVSSPASDPMIGIDTLRQRLMGATLVNDARRSGRFLVGVAPKYEAYNTFLSGLDPFGHLAYARAIPFFERSIAQDSSFGSAYIWLAASHSNSGRWREADSIIAVAKRHESTMTPTDRMQLSYFEAILRGDAAHALQLAQTMAKRDSNPLFMYWVGLDATRMNQPELAIRALEYLHDVEHIMPGWSPYWARRSMAYHEHGDYAEELDYSREIERLFPGYLATRVRSLAALGRVADITRVLDSLAKNYTDTVNAPGDYYLIAGQELRAHGHSADAPAMLQRSIAWYTAHPDEVRRRRAWQSNLAQAHYELGHYDDARAILEALVARDSTSVAYHGRLGLAEAHLGHREAALRVDSILAADQRPYRFGQVEFRRAQIAAALGDKVRAVQLLRQGLAKGLEFTLAWHTDMDLSTLRGTAAFDRMMTPSG